MRKLIIKIIALCFLIVLILIKTENFFIKEDRFNFTKYQFYKVADTTTFDAVFFGSSKSYCSYNPTIFKHNSSISAYNLAGQGQVLEFTGFVIGEALKKSKPKLLVVDVSYGMIAFDTNDSIAEKAKSYQLKIFDNFGLSFNKLKYSYSIYKKDNALYSISPLIRNHDKWMDVNKGYYKRDYLEDKNNLFLFNNGYIGTMHNMKEGGLKIAKKMQLGYETLAKQQELLITDRELEIIKEIRNKAKSNDTEILFVTAPSIEGYVNHLSFYDKLEEEMKSLGINYLNLNKHFNDIGLTELDFKDTKHMNYIGGYKTSKFLSKHIAKQYSFNSKTKVNTLDNNVTFHLLTHLKYTNKLLNLQFQFNDAIKINEIGYFNEFENRYSFIFKLGKQLDIKQVQKFRGYIRYYNGDIINENKKVNSFPLALLEIDDDIYIFARLKIEDINISKLDIFFMDTTTSKASKFLTIKELKLKSNANRQ